MNSQEFVMCFRFWLISKIGTKAEELPCEETAYFNVSMLFLCPADQKNAGKNDN